MSAAQVGPNPATPVSAVASSTARNAAASSAAPAASSSGNAPASSQAASSAAASAQQSSSAQASSSVVASSSAAASSAAASSSSIAASSSSSLASSSASRASSSATLAPAGASTSSTSSKLSAGAIGGIVGGVVGGIVLIALLWMLLRRRKEKKNRVAPPPPRDFREMTFNGSSRPRMGSNNMMSHAQRASSYSTLIHNGRPSSQYPSASRSPSYYATYPVATPSTLPDSPPMPASLSGESPSSSSGEGHGAPVKPALAPIITGLQRDNSDSSYNDREFGVLPKHKSSVDRLRSEGSIRAPSPASTAHGDYSSRATSPHPSYAGPSPSTFPRHSFNPDGGYPRPLSMTSLSSQAQSQSGRLLRPSATPGGRVVQIEMPKPLGARPDASGDFFWQTPKLQGQGFDVGFDGGSVHNHRISRAATELDMYHASHDRMPSTQSSRSTLANPRINSHTSNGSGADERTAKHSRSMQSMRTGSAR